MGVAGAGLLSGQVLAHLLGSPVSGGTYLVGCQRAALSLSPGGLGGRRALLSRCAYRVGLDLGGGRVAEGGHGAGEPVGDTG